MNCYVRLLADGYEKKKLKIHNRRSKTISNLNLQRAKELDKDMESDFIANRAHQNETEGYLIWPQLKLCSHEIVIEKINRKER